MFRFISSITFFLSLLIASNTISEPLSRVSGFNKTDAAKSKNATAPASKNKLSKAERNQKLEAVKDKSSSFIQNFESKIKIAKKVYSAKTKENQTPKVNNKSLGKSSFDPNSVELQVKKRSLPSRTFNISSDKRRNIVNTDQESTQSRDHENSISGTWMLAPMPGALRVGPSPGSGEWWSSSADDVTARACFFDDEYIFHEDGSFQNILGNETWLEGWQGVDAEQCGAPVAPHNGLNPAMWEFNEATGEITLTGLGAYLGLPKAVNAGELPNVDVPESVTYSVMMVGNMMTVIIEAGTGVFWTFELAKEGEHHQEPISGTWMLAPMPGALRVGPSPGSGEWWSSSADDVTARACFFDDEYIFHEDGSFQNILGNETWLEGWQGVDAEQCGAPVAPHNGLNPAMWEFNEATGEITLTGLGAYLGLPKAVNAGELPNVDVPESVTYSVMMVGNMMTVIIEAGTGVFWTFELAKEVHNGEVLGIEYEYSSVADLFANFGTVLESGGVDCAGCEGNLGNMSEYVAASIGGANNGIFEDALSEWSSQFNYGQYYFQFKDDNQNMMYDVGEIYAVSLENGTNGEMHTVSYDGGIYDLDFMAFWLMAYDFEFYPYDGEMGEFWIFDGMGTPPGWEYFQWGNATLSITQGGGMFEGSNALTFVQGDVWSGGGFNIAPSLDLGDAFENGALMFWMWSEPNAPTLRLQFEDGLGKVGTYFIPDPSGGWHRYGFYLDDFVFVDGSTEFNSNAITVFQVMAEGNGLAGRTFHFDEMYIAETEDEGEYISFDWVGNINGSHYYVSQQPMSWHDALNFTDTVNVGDNMIHLATITSGEENNNLVGLMYDFYGVSSEGRLSWIGLTDEYTEGEWQWVTGEPFDFANWFDGQPDNDQDMEHYAFMYSNYESEGHWNGAWFDGQHDISNVHAILEYIPNDNEEMDISGEWQMAPMPGALRVGPEPFSGDWWANSADDVQIRACYFDDRYVFDEEGFHNDQGEETWLEWWQGMDPEGCGAPVFPHDGSSNPAGYVFDDAAGTLTLNGVGSYIGLPKAVNGAELTSPDQAPESVIYQIYMQESPRMMTLVIEVGPGVFWTFDLVPALDGEAVYFVKEDYADVTNPENWDHVTESVAIMRGDNQGLYNPYVEDSYNGLGPSGTLWSPGPTSDSNGMNYMEWVDAIGGNAISLPGQTLSMWCLEENLYFDITFENWTSGNNGGGFSYWRQLVAPPSGPTMHLVSGTMGSDETGDGSFENPFATIGHAVEVMNNDDIIIVMPGLYNENIEVVSKSGVVFAPSGPDSTFISGSGNQIFDFVDSFWALDGLTFTDGVSHSVDAQDGGAIFGRNGQLVVVNSRFDGNTSELNGGAIGVHMSSVFMENVMFINNSSMSDGGAINILNFGDGVEGNYMVGLNNVMIVQNSADGEGAGLYVSSYEGAYTDVVMDNVNIRSNFGYAYSGMKLREQVSGYVSNSFFVGNQAQAYSGAGGATDGATAYVDYTLIALNQSNLNGGAHNSGGMAAWNGSSMWFYQSTFVGNSAEYGSALTVGRGSSATVDGSIIWNNPGDNALAAVQWDNNGSNLDVYNSVVQGGESGMYADELSNIYYDGLLDMDPFFCDPANADFSIDVLSSAITPWGEPMGALGYGCEGTVMAAAHILSVEDVPNDQGGRVYVTFEKSLFDTDGLSRTEMYTIERMDGDQWVGLTSVGAYSSEVYVAEVTTLLDSTSESDAMTTYRVVANMDEGNFESEPASGYSVDNIAPMMVTGLSAEVADGMVMLSWEHSEANDFSHYMIYYGTVVNFIPSEETMIGTHTLPSFEHNVEEMGDHYYIVSSVDMNENESEYSEAVNVTLLSLVDVHGLPETFALHQNYPNPFNPSTTIRYDLPEASSVSLIIYDMMGREVATLMNGQVDAGYHFISWDGTNSIGSSVAAGVYIYTIQAGKHRDVNKMIYLK